MFIINLLKGSRKKSGIKPIIIAEYKNLLLFIKMDPKEKAKTEIITNPVKMKTGKL